MRRLVLIGVLAALLAATANAAPLAGPLLVPLSGTARDGDVYRVTVTTSGPVRVCLGTTADQAAVCAAGRLPYTDVNGTATVPLTWTGVTATPQLLVTGADGTDATVTLDGVVVHAVPVLNKLRQVSPRFHLVVPVELGDGSPAADGVTGTLALRTGDQWARIDTAKTKGGALRFTGQVAKQLVGSAIRLRECVEQPGGDGAVRCLTQRVAVVADTGPFTPVGSLTLRSAAGSGAHGKFTLFASHSTQVFTFQLVARHVPANARREAYGVWLAGGLHPHFLGFAPAVGRKGLLGTSGPRPQDRRRFPRWLIASKRILVTRETSAHPKRPGPAILAGRIAAFESS